MEVTIDLVILQVLAAEGPEGVGHILILLQAGVLALTHVPEQILY